MPQKIMTLKIISENMISGEIPLADSGTIDLLTIIVPVAEL
jgi:hypothetical protein